jgi:hypothetical protein
VAKLKSDEFKKIISDAVSKGTTESNVAQRLAVAAPFKRFAKAAKLPTERKALESWITSSLSRESAKE